MVTTNSNAVEARGIVNRYIREVGPMSDLAPAFPLAAGASQPMRAAASM